jgi:hypothetical protein
MVYDVKLGICRNVEQMTIPRTNYSAMIIHSDYNSRNKIISVKLFDNSDIPVYGARKSLTDTVNKYLAGKELDPQDIEYVSIPIDYGHVNQIVMIKHRGDR